MKKIAASSLSLCLCVGVLGDVKYTVSSKEIPKKYHCRNRLTTAKIKKSSLENVNYVFSEKD